MNGTDATPNTPAPTASPYARLNPVVNLLLTLAGTVVGGLLGFKIVSMTNDPWSLFAACFALLVSGGYLLYGAVHMPRGREGDKSLVYFGGVMSLMAASTATGVYSLLVVFWPF